MSIERPEPSSPLDPEDYQTDDAAWGLFVAQQEELKRMKSEYATMASTWQEREKVFGTESAEERSHLEGLEAKYLEMYKGDEARLAIVRETMKEAREAQRAYEEAHARGGRALAAYANSIDEMEESLRELFAQLKQVRN